MTTRRTALRNLAAYLAASPLARPQRDLPYKPEHFPSLDQLVNVFEFEPLSKARLLKQNYDYIAGGVDGEWTLRRNREAFDLFELRPRVMVDATAMDLSLTLFGDKISMPILIAPTAGHTLCHPEGELATARAAAQQKTILVISINAGHPIEKITAASGGFPTWYQLYPGPDLEGTREHTERAVAAGCKVVMLTVDAHYNSHRERLLRNRIATQVPSGISSPQARRRRREDEPPHPYRLQPQLMASLTWSFLDELNSYAKVPVVLKGILTAEDARLAVERGAAGIVVSNHGGRYLDYAPAPIEVLEEIVDAAGGKIPVMVDSGFRRGTDVLKALAIGARAVLVGRPPLWGLSAFGQPGVEKILELLQTELALAMGLCGKRDLASIDRSLIRRTSA